MQRSVTFKLIERVPPRSSKEAFWVAFLACLLTCSCILFVLTPLTGVSEKFGTRSHDGYIELARNLVAGNGYVLEEGGPPVFHRPPLYPLLLVPVALFPEFLQRPVLVLIQSLMVGGIGFLVFELSSKLFNLTTGKLSVVVFLLNPWLYWNAKNPMTPILQAFLYMCFLFLIFREIIPLLLGDESPVGTEPKSNMPPWLLIGLSGALLALTHGTMLAVYLIWLLAIFVIGAYRRNSYAMRSAIFAGLVGIAVISPWTYRNWVVFNRFIPIVGGGGLMYFHGNNRWSKTNPNLATAHGEKARNKTRKNVVREIDKNQFNWHGLKDSKLDNSLARRMIRDIIAHPEAFASKIALNAVDYYFPAISYPFLAYKKKLRKEDLVLTGFHLLLWTLAFLGLLVVRKRKHYFNVVILLFVAVTFYAIWYLPFIASIGHSLYTFGTMPILSILVANGVASMWSLKLRSPDPGYLELQESEV